MAKEACTINIGVGGGAHSRAALLDEGRRDHAKSDWRTLGGGGGADAGATANVAVAGAGARGAAVVGRGDSCEGSCSKSPTMRTSGVPLFCMVCESYIPSCIYPGITHRFNEILVLSVNWDGAN